MFPIPSILTGLNLAAVKWAVIALASIGLALTAYSHGRHVAEGEIAEAQRETALAYAAEIIKTQATADQLATENTALRSAQAPKDRIITQEITRYVQVTPPADRCVLPGTWRLRHDAAATGMPTAPETGPLAIGAAEPVDDAAALQTVSDNYLAARDCIAKVEAWQRRYRELEQ